MEFSACVLSPSAFANKSLKDHSSCFPNSYKSLVAMKRVISEATVEIAQCFSAVKPFFDTGDAVLHYVSFKFGYQVGWWFT